MAESAGSSRYPRLHVLRYMGSKLALVDRIAPVIEDLAGGHPVVDLMAGTHVLGYALKPHLTVWANDVQQYSQVLGAALLGVAPGDLPLDQLNAHTQAYLDRAGAGYFEQVYADTYFSPQQCREIDAVRTAIASLPPPYQARSLAALMATMSYCQSTPGHFAQFFPPYHPRVQSLRRMSIWETFREKLQWLHAQLVPGRGHNPISGWAAEAFPVPDSAAVAYLDPPYTSDQYSRFYHLLETVVKYDAPQVQHKGRYRTDRFRSDFCYPTRVEEAFRRVLSRWSQADRSLVISYVKGGLLPLEQLYALVRRFYHQVAVIPLEHRHSSMGKGEQRVTEVLVVATQARRNTKR